MNDKLCKHVNILFAAAPRNQKAEEIKEELLTNLNDKYDDLLANGYDSTAAFHLALSGIGDIDELLKECGGTVQADAPPILPTPQASRLPMYSVLAFLLFCAFPVLPVILSIFGNRFTGELFCFFLVWVYAGSVVLYGMVSSYTRRSSGAESTPAAPIFSKRKIVRMLVLVGLAIGILIFVDLLGRNYPMHDLRWFFDSCYLVAGGFYIYAFVALFRKDPSPTEGANVPAVPSYFFAPKPSRMPMVLGLIAGLIVGLPILAPGVVPFFIVGGSTGFGVFGMFLCVAVAGGLFAFVITYVIASFCMGQTRKTEVYQRQLLAQAEDHGLSKEYVLSELRRVSSVSKLYQVALVLAIILLSFLIGSFVYHAVLPLQKSLLDNTITPTGPVIIEEREIDMSDIDIIDVHSALSVEFKLSDRDYLTVETHEDMLPSIKTDIRDGSSTLTIRQDSRVRYRNVQKLHVIVYSRSVPKVFYTHAASRLTCDEPLKVDSISLYASGASQLRFKNIESTGSVNFKIDGASTVEVAGSAESVLAQISGASQLRASNLDVNRCDVTISGASRAELGTISGELSLRASGASRLDYRGTPTIKKQEVSGAVKIFDR